MAAFASSPRISRIGGSATRGTTTGEPSHGGRLEDTILRLLKRGRRPLSALALTARIGREGRVVPASMVFRAIRKLIARGSIRKVHVARAYAIGGEAAGISLVCGKCARLSEVPGGDVLRELERIASARGLSVSRYVVEILGTCSACQGQGAAGLAIGRLAAADGSTVMPPAAAAPARDKALPG